MPKELKLVEDKTETALLEQQTGAKTLFLAEGGTNRFWAFTPEGGKPGVAIADGKGSQVVVRLSILKAVVEQMETAIAANQS